MNLFTFTAYALGFDSELIPAMSYPNQDEHTFEEFNREFKTHIPTIQNVGMDFYLQEEAKKLLKHLAEITGYNGIWF